MLQKSIFDFRIFDHVRKITYSEDFRGGVPGGGGPNLSVVGGLLVDFNVTVSSS